MTTWTILIILLIIILIVWWALARNARKYKPDFDMHHDESHAEHGDEGEAATAQYAVGHSDAGYKDGRGEELGHAEADLGEDVMHDATFRAHAGQVEAAQEAGIVDREVTKAYQEPTSADVVKDDASNQEAIQRIADGAVEDIAPPAPVAAEVYEGVPASPAGPGGESSRAPSLDIKPDDLIIIEGIGPKVNQLLQNAGIYTFAQLADTSPEKLREILVPAGLRVINPASWPAQARLAADGKMEELKELQKRLTAGRDNNP